MGEIADKILTINNELVKNTAYDPDMWIWYDGKYYNRGEFRALLLKIESEDRVGR